MNATSVRELRDSTGTTQKEFAALYHIPLSTLKKWEQGSASPPDYVIELIARSLPIKDRTLKRIGSGKDVFYIDTAGNIIEDRFGSQIPVKADLSKVKPQNLLLYIKELFASYYEIRERFERDCKYDEEEDILWSDERFS